MLGSFQDCDSRVWHLLPQFKVSSFLDASHYGNNSLCLGYWQLLQKIEYDVWRIIKEIQKRRNQMPNISCISYIYGRLAMEKYVIIILMGVITRNTSWWTIDSSAFELYTRRKAFSTNSPNQIPDFWRYFQFPYITPISRFPQMVIIDNVFNTYAISTSNIVTSILFGLPYQSICINLLVQGST